MDSNVLSLLTPEEVEKIGGLPVKAICGEFEGDELLPEFFRVNPAFVDFMHSVIGTKGSGVLSLTEAAKNQKEGYLYVIDFRTPKGILGNVPSEDIIGAFKVENGKVIENSYQRNESHKIYTKNGLVKLPPGLYELLIEELKK